VPTATGEVVEVDRAAKVTEVIGVIGKRRLDGLALIKLSPPCTSDTLLSSPIADSELIRRRHPIEEAA
jgi:hypothetical protein